MKNAMIAVVNTPGAASGTTALRNAWNGVAPSTCAACSSSQGICRKNAARVQMEIGNVNDRYGMIRPGQVSYSPMERHRLNSGVTRSEEHTSELQSRGHLVCRLLIEKKKEDNKDKTKEHVDLQTTT